MTVAAALVALAVGAAAEKNWGLSSVVLVAEVPKTVDGRVELVKAEEVHVRKGAGNFLAKMKAGKPVTVAYLGGSITEMSGWRNMTTDWLRKTYPAAEVEEVHAAIGGTGSGLGVFRLGHDALSKNPDLLFVEFATNDSREPAESIWRNFDGIVQQTWRKNPKTDIVFVYTITTRMMGEYGSGKMNHAASAMEHLADYYGIPSVCFGPRVAEEVKAERLIMSLGEVPTAVPKETPDRDRLINEELKKKGQTLFAKDGVPVHLYDSEEGYYYLTLVDALLVGLPAIVLMLGIGHFAGKALKGRAANLVLRTSSDLNRIYLIHWIFVLWVVNALLYRTCGLKMSSLTLLVISFVILALSAVLARCRPFSRFKL